MIVLSEEVYDQLTEQQLLVYLWLYRHSTEGKVSVSCRELGDRWEIPQNTMWRMLQKFQTMGLINIEKGVTRSVSQTITILGEWNKDGTRNGTRKPFETKGLRGVGGTSNGTRMEQEKKVPFSPPKENTPTPLKEITPLLSPQESALHHRACAHENFAVWLKTNCPYIFGHLKMMTENEFIKLKTQYGSQAISEVCLDLENRRDLRNKYTNLYRTLLNWLKRRGNENVRTNNERAEREQGAARLVAELLATNKPV